MDELHAKWKRAAQQVEESAAELETAKRDAAASVEAAAAASTARAAESETAAAAEAAAEVLKLAAAAAKVSSAEAEKAGFSNQIHRNKPNEPHLMNKRTEPSLTRPRLFHASHHRQRPTFV